MLVFAGEDDYGLVIEAVSSCASKWKSVSGKLGLPISKINSIESENPGNVANCWNKALGEWLLQNYNTTKYPSPSWQSLLRIIAREEFILFKKLASEHKAQSKRSHVTSYCISESVIKLFSPS